MDKDYNIDINFNANTNDATSKLKKFEDLIKQISDTVGNVKVDKRKKVYKNTFSQITSIEKATHLLNETNKQRIKIEKDLLKYSALGQEGKIAGAKESLKGVNLQQANILEGIKNNPQVQAELNQLNIQSEQEKIFENSRKSLEKFMLSLDPVAEKMSKLQEKMKAAQEEFIKLNSTGASTKGAEKQIKKLAKQMDNLQNSTQKSASWASKLMGRIRNISIYRAIRSGLKWLTSGVSEGLKGLAEYSGDVNSTMSNINNSLGQIRNTLAISFASVLQALEPIITQLSGMLVDLINSFNLAMAKMQGKNAYTKAKKAADDYAKSAEKARKLSFDTFEVLSGGDDKTAAKDLFEEGSIVEDTSKLSETLFTVLKTIKDIAGVIGTLIKQVIDAGIFDNLVNILGDIVIAIGQIISTLVTSGAMKTILEVIGEITNIAGTLLGFFASIVGALSEMGALKPIIYGLVAAWAAYKAIMIAVTLATWAKTSADIAQKSVATWGAFAVAGAAIVGGAVAATAAIMSQVKGYETGGIPNKSELFYMNENGVPEALVNTGGSQTNVINIDQLSEGMRRGFIQAIYDTNLLDTIRDNGNTTIMIDRDVLGQTVASSAGFRNEMNRRNANLNLI